MRVVAIHQPNYLPWFGFIHKIAKSDLFVILDHVEFSRRSFINRNRVKGPNGEIWLTVPVKVHGRMRIMDVPIDTEQKWREKHLKSLRLFYGKAPYFKEIFPHIEEVYERDRESLADLNVDLIYRLIDILNLRTKFVRSSTLNPQGKKMEMIVDICKKVDADAYLSGQGAKKYQDSEYFSMNGINLIYQEFEHPVYPQRFGKFVPNLSIVDMLFNVGVEGTLNFIQNA